MGFEVKLLADSISPAGHRLTSLAVSYPRIIHAEMLRHRVFSRCASSSRAIPVARFLDQVENDPYIPEHWGKNQKGMQSGAELSPEECERAVAIWKKIRSGVMDGVRELLELGVHKQWTNRWLEPAQWMTEIITGTEWSNFEHLRVHPAAHPDIQRIAREMVASRENSTPTLLSPFEWHLPYIEEADRERARRETTSPSECERRLARVSIGRAARASYLKLDDESNYDKDLARAEDMLGNGHMSPFEHAARPMTKQELDHYKRNRVVLDDGSQFDSRHDFKVGGYEDGKTVVSVTPYYFCGNFNGWIQYRKSIPHEEDLLCHVS
jgi:thymidylate synthase ThyX